VRARFREGPAAPQSEVSGDGAKEGEAERVDAEATEGVKVEGEKVAAAVKNGEFMMFVILLISGGDGREILGDRTEEVVCGGTRCRNTPIS
jgi:hypothetical protein